MVWFCFGEENNSSRRVILKIELELNNLNSILSRSAVTPVFPAICNPKITECTDADSTDALQEFTPQLARYETSAYRMTISGLVFRKREVKLNTQIPDQTLDRWWQLMTG